MSDGENIKNIRRKKGLTQEELGSLLGVGKSAVSRWENGEREVTLATMRSIAAALDVPLECLVEGLDPPTQSSDDHNPRIDKKRENIYNRTQISPHINDEKIAGTRDETDPEHIGAISETQENFTDRPHIHLTIPQIDDPELISAFEGFKELDKLTPSDIEDIKAILKLAQRIIDKRKT